MQATLSSLAGSGKEVSLAVAALSGHGQALKETYSAQLVISFLLKAADPTIGPDEKLSILLRIELWKWTFLAKSVDTIFPVNFQPLQVSQICVKTGENSIHCKQKNDCCQ